VNYRALLGVCGFGLFLRIAFIFLSNAEVMFPDEQRFLEEAESILAGTGLQAGGNYGHDMPITALVVAVFLSVSGGSILAVKLVMAVFSTLTIFLGGKLCFILSKDNLSALLAAGIFAVYPFFIFYSTLILSETLFLFLFLLFLCSLLDTQSSSTEQGIAAGLMHLTKPIFFYFFPVIWLWQYKFQKESVKKIVISVFVLAVVASPWVIRNFIVFDSLVLNTASSGHILWEGNNPWNKTGGVSGTFENPDAWIDLVPDGLNELETDLWKKNQAIIFIKDNPLFFFRTAIKKFLRFWSLWPNSDDHQDWIYKAASVFSFGPVLALSMIGIFTLRRCRKEMILFASLIIYLTLLHIVTLGSIRYRLPLEPVMIIVASMTLVQFFRKRND